MFLTKNGEQPHTHVLCIDVLLDENDTVFSNLIAICVVLALRKDNSNVLLKLLKPVINIEPKYSPHCIIVKVFRPEQEM